MGTVGYLLLLLLAAIVSTQVLMLSSRRTPLDKRLRDLSEGGDAASLGIAASITFGALGAFIGHLFDAPGSGAAAGLAIALLSTAAAIIWAHKRRQLPPRHRGD
ncbi:hypothetical protein ACGFIF_21130 [Kribbella sp. NPDC049174]|uniref:hypothetical protein n=1 Tax=Kribbella sp. NPDC049174 TaxID=3364112 RepID=UPI003719A8D2